MAIESISGGTNAATPPVRTNTDLVRKEEEDSEDRASANEAASQRNEDARSKQAANEERMEDFKSVKEVDTNA